jgi:hypothetical protein
LTWSLPSTLLPLISNSCAKLCTSAMLNEVSGLAASDALA